uniref:PDZ domain-containing protein n=1 Tax=Grammatophora oceanica TaxID=210454 RepID=A0A7S1UM64_9STRA|mmetsp:Transcript_12250/g.17970  ORF Transcript_12250/g.17970 Transcript_12250/m.17970 type:complete len:474 (+) Transcript_12250:123-1544(+)|eukprot:CAMPEP_0194029940 /NCGR_PEP_ID=MMETSP0009_2-20130614/3557_1 /TAXON_ID=210454 /ORGANISM="Grammatophora oceanica, Strain CCMP 410" /LENGTH=473 /DNA_ID=CAMNT_0038669765 /DNA_START=123 /DNA_END=1544 /DNA_ORIENTATION=+
MKRLSTLIGLPIAAFACLRTTEAFATKSSAIVQHGTLENVGRHQATKLLSQSGELSEHNPNAFFRRCRKSCAGALLGISFAVALSLPHPAALAADYGSLTDEQMAVAEAWRLVDNSYLDRSFNGQDWFKIRQDAVKAKYKDINQARGAIDKMVASLGDKYTRYLSPSKYQSIVDSATGTLAGVGCEIGTTKDGRVFVADVEPNSPASLSGIQPKDVFIEVDGSRFDDPKATPDDVAIKLRGPEGSKVGVTIERNGKESDFIITRQPITITSVKSYMTDKTGVGKVGVIKIKSFSGTTAEKVKQELESLKKKGAKSIVFDLRSNPGGLLPGGTDTASLFLQKDSPLVFVVSKTGVIEAQETFTDGIDLETPLVVLVDSNTASASEVMTAALQENGRATVAGEQTFGKGIIQTVKPLSNSNGGIAVTVARYETPQHHDINKRGIPVDVSTKVDCDKLDASACLPDAKAFKAPSQS